MRPKPSAEAMPTGMALLHDPLLNKGTAFSPAERDVLGLRGLLPPHVCTPAEQMQRVLENLRREPTPLDKYINLSARPRGARDAIFMHEALAILGDRPRSPRPTGCCT
jgi:malate dehydrogenase (oxaloacetate-decarboxylating)(NADP+)